MKNILVFMFLSILLASCNSYSSEAQKINLPIENKNLNIPNTNQKSGVSVEVNSLNVANEREIAEIESIKQKEREEKERVPQQFRNIDFKNFTYPSFHLERKFKLKNGELEIDKERWSSTFQAVEYVDLNTDGRKDALVELTETSVGGSSYTSFSYFIYTIRNKKPLLLWKFHTGSESSCGHKSIIIEDRKIILEVFGICSFNNMSSENYSGDMRADNFTRFSFGWNGRKFIQEKREVLPFPERDVYKYLYNHTLEELIQ